MTSEMVERVARSMCLAKGCDPDDCGIVSPSPSIHSPAIKMLKNWECRIKEATAAIEAMREPTEEQIESSAMVLDWYKNVDNHALAKQCYIASINAALKGNNNE